METTRRICSPVSVYPVVAVLLFSLLLLLSSISVAFAIIPQTMKVGKEPWGITVNEKTNKIYVANWESGTISVIDGERDVVVKTINDMPAITGLTVNERTNMIYVTGSQSHKTFVIDGNVDEIIRTFDFATTASAVDSVANKVYLAQGSIGSAEGTIYVVDGSANEITAQISGIGKIEGMAVNEKTKMVYATQDQHRHWQNYATGLVHVIDGTTDEVISSIDVDRTPRQIVINTATDKAYIANPNPLLITVIDLKTNNASSIELDYDYGFSTGAIAANLQSNKIYTVAGFEINVIDGNTDKVVDKVELQDGYGIAVNSRTNKIYVTNHELDSVAVIDGSTNQLVISLASYSIESKVIFALAGAATGAILAGFVLKRRMLTLQTSQMVRVSRWSLPVLPLTIVSIYLLVLTGAAFAILGYIFYALNTTGPSSGGGGSVFAIIYAFVIGLYLLLASLVSLAGSVTSLRNMGRKGFYVSLTSLVLWTIGLVIVALSTVQNPDNEAYWYGIVIPIVALMSSMYSFLIFGNKLIARAGRPAIDTAR